MGRQFRSPRSGGSNVVAPAWGYVGSIQNPSCRATAIPNYGVTDISTWAAGDYVLDAPVEGVLKTFVSIQGTSAARVIRGSTAASVKFGSTAHTQLNIGGSTVACCITLLGYNSTQWLIMSAHPVATTGAGFVSATS